MGDYLREAYENSDMLHLTDGTVISLNAFFPCKKSELKHLFRIAKGLRIKEDVKNECVKHINKKLEDCKYLIDYYEDLRFRYNTVDSLDDGERKKLKRHCTEEINKYKKKRNKHKKNLKWMDDL